MSTDLQEELRCIQLWHPPKSTEAVRRCRGESQQRTGEPDIHKKFNSVHRIINSSLLAEQVNEDNFLNTVVYNQENCIGFTTS